MTKRRAVIELLFADLFWGFSFVAVPMAQRSWDSSQIAFLRFAIPAILGITIGYLLKRGQLSKIDFRHGLAPGFFFAATIYTQTIGLEYTTPSKSSFITVLYVIFVPLLETYLHRKRLTWTFWLAIAGALLGLALLFNLEWSSWNTGDTITFACALFATWHIHQVSLVSRRFRHPFLFNLSQCFWAAVFLLPLALMSHHPLLPSSFNLSALFGLGMITFGATTIAFSIQARAQPYLSLSTSSVIFLLESPLAMFFSWWLLNETIAPLQLVGALVILLSCSIAVRQSLN
jgi:drug/metabolite transporter (DMT)-like permease